MRLPLGLVGLVAFTSLSRFLYLQYQEPLRKVISVYNKMKLFNLKIRPLGFASTNSHRVMSRSFDHSLIKVKSPFIS